MFPPNDTDGIHRKAHEHIERLHHEARAESGVQSLHISFRIRLASALRRIAAWIEPQRAAVRAPAPPRARYEVE